MSDRLPPVQADFADDAQEGDRSPKSQAMPLIADQSESFASQHPAIRGHVQALLDLRREHFNLVNEKRKVDQELSYARQDNEVLLEAHN